MTPQTISTAWFILGAALVTLGPLTIFLVAREVLAERRHPPAKSDVIARVNRAALITPSESGLDALMTELLNESMQRRGEVR